MVCTGNEKRNIPGITAFWIALVFAVACICITGPSVMFTVDRTQMPAIAMSIMWLLFAIVPLVTLILSSIAYKAADKYDYGNGQTMAGIVISTVSLAVCIMLALIMFMDVL